MPVRWPAMPNGLGSMPPSFHSAREEPRFERERDALIPHPVLADQLLQSVIDAVCRRPEIGQTTDQPGVVAVTVPASPIMPAVVIYYTFDAERVYLLSIAKADPEAEGWESFFP